MLFIERTIQHTLAYLHFLLALFTLGSNPQALNVEVVAPVTGGEPFVAVYASPEGFRPEEELVSTQHALHPAAATAEIDLPLPARGEYVVAGFQDLNGNGKLDKNFFGVPTEPYGFARVPPSKWRAPSFGEVATPVANGDRVTIELRHWDAY